MEENSRRTARKRRKSKPKAIFVKRRIVFLASLALIFFFVIIKGIVSVVSSNLPTVTVVEESYRDEEFADAFIVMDEHVQKVSSENLKFKFKDGEKVAKGEVFATARVLPNDEQKNELKTLSEKIDLYNDLFENYKYYIGTDERSEEDIDAYIKKLKAALGEDQTSKADKVKKDILEHSDNSIAFFEEKINSLEKNRDRILKDSGLGNKSYKAEVSGLFSSKTDDFEKELSLKNIEKIDFDKFNSLASSYEKSKRKENLNTRYKSIRFVDNTSWYALVKANIDYKRYLDTKNTVNFTIPSTNINLSGKLVDTKENDREMLLLLKFDQRLHEVLDLRYVKAKVEKDTYYGLKVPSTSIVTREGNTVGVFVKDISGIVRFCPVNIIYRDKDYAIVKKEETELVRATIDGKVKDVRTLKTYDEVLRYGSLAKENNIIN